jgi:hypothetical protein
MICLYKFTSHFNSKLLTRGIRQCACLKQAENLPKKTSETSENQLSAESSRNQTPTMVIKYLFKILTYSFLKSNLEDLFCPRGVKMGKNRLKFPKKDSFFKNSKFHPVCMKFIFKVKNNSNL